jgi:hypothetical protein
MHCIIKCFMRNIFRNQGAMTFSIMTLTLKSFRIMDLFSTLSIMSLGICTKCHDLECHYPECRIVFMLSAVMLSGVSLNVVRLNVVAPKQIVTQKRQ